MFALQSTLLTQVCHLRAQAVPGPGQLFKALSVFALRGVDMTKIESRPMRQGIAAAVEHEPDMAGTPAGRSSGNGAGAGAGAKAKHFDYLFYVDLVGGLGDDVIQNALRHLQVRGTYSVFALHLSFSRRSVLVLSCTL